MASRDSADVSSLHFAPPGVRVEEDTLCDNDSLSNCVVDKEFESSSAASAYIRTYIKRKKKKMCGVSMRIDFNVESS